MSGMHWFVDMFFFLAVCALLALPFAVIAGWTWWVKSGNKFHGWRNLANKLGVLYSTLIVVLIVVSEMRTPHNSPTGAGYQYAYHWAPIIFRFSAVGLVLALVGRGWARATNLICALGGCGFATMLIAWL